MNIKVLRQYCVPQHALSRLAGKIAECRWKWLKNWIIRRFIKQYGVDMSLAQIENIEDYPHFNSFFTRRLKPTARSIVEGPSAIACPVDGSISQIGRIKQESLFQAKGFHFQLRPLLGGVNRWADLFENGYFSTIYLAPKDYHRVHMPLHGSLIEAIYIPGKLFSVNHLTTHSIPALFSRNERLVCVFETKAGPMIIILVGAMLVASINTVWQSTFNTKTITTYHPQGPIELERGAELGHFKLGSTVIVLFTKGAIEWNSSLGEDSIVQMGQLLGSCMK
jgi:phosphatidylserine decarboxylase